MNADNHVVNTERPAQRLQMDSLGRSPGYDRRYLHHNHRMSVDALIATSADELRRYGLWVVSGPDHLWVAHYFERPTGTPTLAGPRKATSDFDQPQWSVTFHERLVDVYGFPLDIACDTDPESGLSGAPNRSIAVNHCDDGYIFLGDFNGINRNTGRWIPNDAPAWRFSNKIQNVIGGVDPHGVIRVTNDLDDAYSWLKAYNECYENMVVTPERD
jgi:hypothetical protein